jgi:divalent metal cation (Fe/Co/Zn/Cd) transporter
MASITYTPGVCNIGPDEIKRRRSVGWIGLVVTVIAAALLFYYGVNPWWRLVLVLPATLSVSGFLQAYFGFCTGFAMKGVYNFDKLGAEQHITDAASKAKDKKKGNSIMMYSVIVGIIVTAVLFFA